MLCVAGPGAEGLGRTPSGSAHIGKARMGKPRALVEHK